MLCFYYKFILTHILIFVHIFVHLFCNNNCVQFFVGDEMKKLKIKNDIKRKDTITRTIRMSGTTFDKISALAEKNQISFNSVVNQILEYGLENIEDM